MLNQKRPKAKGLISNFRTIFKQYSGNLTFTYQILFYYNELTIACEIFRYLRFHLFI